jgi:RimJ/RimL family protein N-acetyltransferase
MMSPTIPGPAYRIQTERLVLRCWDPRDAPLLQAAIDASLEHLWDWMQWARGEPQDLQTKIGLLRRFRGNFDLGNDFVYGIFNPEESQVLGGTGFHTQVGKDALEIGYWIHVDFINRGLATETARALTRVAFTVNEVKRVEIHCDHDNVRSAAVPRKLGFVHEATLRRRDVTPGGEPRDTMIWTLLDDEFPDSPAASAAIQAFDAIGRRIL